MIPWCFQVYHCVFSIYSRCAPTLILWHWHSLHAVGNSAASPKSCLYITRLDKRSRATRSWGTFSHLLILWLFWKHSHFIFLYFYSWFFFRISTPLCFLCPPCKTWAVFSVSSSYRRCGRVSVTLTSRSAAGHHRYRSRCVESDCCTSPSLCQVCQQQPLSPSGSHCCVTPGRGQCANQIKQTAPSQMH